jgi:hypothetical protein
MTTDTQPLTAWDIAYATQYLDVDMNAEVPCQWLIPCDTPATWALVNGCCGFMSSVCDPHKQRTDAALDAMREGAGYDCRKCKASNSDYTWRPI